MTILDRVLVLLGALLFAISGFLLFFVAGGWNPALALGELISGWALTNSLIPAVIGFLVLLLGVYLFLLALRGLPEERFIEQEASLGVVRISFRALERLIYKAVRQLSGVRDLDITLKAAPEGLVVAIGLEVQPDLNIPSVVEEVQSSIAEYLLRTTGISVGRVYVEVRRIARTEQAEA
ncbi:MAG TPA: alkaline shock response membrane anchor protein AmaP [Firmicutes bacterium]|nr:alkaline shock response membrane anchor protein AmaP [Bacillota bacterium]